MSKPEVLMIGPYPSWDMEDLESRYTIHRLWEVEDRDTFLAQHGDGIRAVATRGELGASAELLKKPAEARNRQLLWRRHGRDRSALYS